VALEPLDPLAVTLSIANVSFVAQVVDWAPDLLFPVLRAAWRHRGLSFVRVLQRCPNYLPQLFDGWIRDPASLRVLEHPDGLVLDDASRKAWPTRIAHDPSDLAAARLLAADAGKMAVGILYRNDAVPCYEDLQQTGPPLEPDAIVAAVDAELDRYAVRPAREA
jgi:2-oxoglutarate ferredoxin oxidoreductase subunit beta